MMPWGVRRGPGPGQPQGGSSPILRLCIRAVRSEEEQELVGRDTGRGAVFQVHLVHGAESARPCSPWHSLAPATCPHLLCPLCPLSLPTCNRGAPVMYIRGGCGSLRRQNVPEPI